MTTPRSTPPHVSPSPLSNSHLFAKRPDCHSEPAAAGEESAFRRKNPERFLTSFGMTADGLCAARAATGNLKLLSEIFKNDVADQRRGDRDDEIRGREYILNG